MKRREFIALVGSTAAWPVVARAQQRARLPTIGYLGPSDPARTVPTTSAFLQSLRELGWDEGTVVIEHRWAAGRPDRVAEIAAEFVRLKVDLIVTTSTNDSLAMKQATTVIPIVFAVAGDPVGTGLVASLARPGANLTGLSTQQTDTGGKRIELLRELLPGLRRLAILVNPESPNVRPELSQVQAAARAVGLTSTNFEIRSAADIASALATAKAAADALYVVTDPLVSTHRTSISDLVLGARLPAMYGSREYVEAGGLMSYGANLPDLYRRAAQIADRILRGAKPADMPVEQPTRFDLVVNLKTARALELPVPDSLLARADTVID